MAKHSLGSVVKNGWTNFKRNSYLSFAVTGIMALVLILFLGLLTFQFVSTNIIASVQEKVDISAYFKTTTEEGQILEVKSDLERLPEVAEVAYTSREAAKEEFKLRHADNELIQESLNQLDENPFEASLNISAKNPNNYEGIAKFLENNKFRDDMSKINYNENKGVIDKINKYVSTMRLGGLVATLVIAVIAILITFNTIRLTIYNQRQEIEIMRLVGASNWHIRGPFLAEGSFYGIIASVAALAIFYPVLYAVSDTLATLMSGVDTFAYFVRNSWEIVLAVLLAGVVLGVLSSAIAIKRHLKI